MEKSSNAGRQPHWIKSILNNLGLKDSSSLTTIFDRTDEVASQLAPDTRRLWKWILLMEGGAVLLPLLWLLVIRLRWTPLYTGYTVTVFIFLVVGICWWLRWRGMQHTWVRARLVAEIVRSAVNTAWMPGRPTVDALVDTPDLQAWAAELPKSPDLNEAIDPETLKERYLNDRINDQLQYYQSKRKNAILDRQRLSRYVTWSLDGALFLSVAGLVLVHNDSGLRFLRLSGADYVLGIVGTLLPLIAILMQTLSSYLELNRRTGRYAHQVEVLNAAKVRMQKAGSQDEVLAVVRDVERTLLGEVVDWFYEAEQTESFYRSKTPDDSSEVTCRININKNKWTSRLLSITAMGASYAARVVFGRILVIALSMVITTALINYYAAQDSQETSRIQELGSLLSSPTSKGWTPIPKRAKKGFILIAHGLHDGVDTDPQKSKDLHWMSKMQQSLETALKSDLPDICLVDWSDAAIPGKSSSIKMELDRIANEKGLPSTAQGWLQDVVAIRPQGENVGMFIGFKLAMAILEGKIKQNRPMHFIGHSAGGFVVLHAALVLHKLKLAPKNLRITILDTPFPVVDDIKEALEFATIDYYCSSNFAIDVPATKFHKDYKRFDIKVPAGIDSYTGAHSYSHSWFNETILNQNQNPDPYPDGFRRSPLWKDDKLVKDFDK